MAHNGTPFQQLGPPWYLPVVVAFPPISVLQAPDSTWGIAYDLYLHDMEDPLGRGWHKRRGVFIHIQL
jgi:hypothetical protein